MARKEDRYIRKKEIMEILGIKESKAYEIIRKLNAELESKGYLTINARVPRKYFYERFGI